MTINQQTIEGKLIGIMVLVGTQLVVQVLFTVAVLATIIHNRPVTVISPMKPEESAFISQTRTMCTNCTTLFFLKEWNVVEYADPSCESIFEVPDKVYLTSRSGNPASTYKVNAVYQVYAQGESYVANGAAHTVCHMLVTFTNDVPGKSN